MATAEFETEAARQLERILESPGFARNERLSRFLRFVVERHLEGRDIELKESVIGVEVFGRPPDYNPKQDAIVRTEAGRLRARLSEYYLSEGKDDSLAINLPKGGYVPVIRQVEETPAVATLSLGKRKVRLWALVALGCFVLTLAAATWWRSQQAASMPIPIAVLPLTSLSQNPADDYFADGLTDEIIRNLSIIDGLAVRSRTSSFVFKGKSRNVREAGQQLEADYILEGSVLRAGQHLRVNVQMVRTRDDFPVWSGRYDREVSDVLAIQDDISRGIVNGLRLKLGRGRRRYEISAEAYDLYLRARSLNGVQGRARDRIAAFQEVIGKEPAFAPAYAGLATAYAFDSGTFTLERSNSDVALRDADGQVLDLPDELERMRAAAEKAIQLDPLLAEAYDALGAGYARDARWEESEKSFRRALELDANTSTGRNDFVEYLLLPLGRVEEAVRQMRIAEKADPLSPQTQAELGYALLSDGRYDDAAVHCEKASDSECLGRVRIAQGRIAEAIQILAAVPNPRYYGHALGRAGRREEAEKLTGTIAKHPFQQALIFAGLGDKDRTFEALNRMTVQGPVRIGRDLTLPEFSLIRGDPRVKALRKKVGLPE